MSRSCRLIIGGLSVQFDFTPEAFAAAEWDRMHRPFLTGPCENTALDARLRVHAGRPLCHDERNYSELLADGGLWRLCRDPATGGQRITLYGCPQGTLDMSLHWAVPKGHMLVGDLYLGPPPEDQERIPIGYPLTPLLWTILLGRQPTERAGLLCHACGVQTPDGRGLLFSGFSGAGKSTTSRLWRTFCPEASILSDDRVILRADKSSATGYMLYGTPWPGEDGTAVPSCAPLHHLFVLGRSRDGLSNQCQRLSPVRAAAELLVRTTPPIWDTPGTTAAVALASDVAQAVPSAFWNFVPFSSAVKDLL